MTGLLHRSALEQAECDFEMGGARCPCTGYGSRGMSPLDAASGRPDLIEQVGVAI